ncbi:MAG: FxLYD domain-containing protein, partial [Pyrinomonadaceae bacterium]|nr:FxLYD domain-containing protein [Pyrinomonadaceae bacterium]
MQILKKITMLAFLLSACAVGALAQNVNVTATGGTASASYATLTAAFDAVNAGTHTGAITMNIVASTTETANLSAVLNSSGAGSASYTSVLIRPTVDGVSITGTGGTGTACGGKGLIELNGADNVTIDGDNPNSAGTNRNLTLTDTCIGTYASVIRIALATTIVTSADNVTIRNLIINGSAPGRNISTATSTTGTENTTYGIYASGSASTVAATTAPTAIASTSTVIGAGATAANLTIDNNTITTAARAVAIQGSATTVFPGLAITGNTIGNPTGGAVDGVYSFGITAQGSANAVIARNTVYVESFLATGIRGIDTGSVSATGTGFTFERNQVNRIQNNSTTGFGAYGINISSGGNHIVRNNFVSGATNVANGNFSTTFGAFGIRVASGTGHQIYHNSINLYGTQTGTGQGFSAALVLTSTATTGLDIRNNIFADTQSGGSATSVFVSVYFPTGLTSASNITLNNNDYFQGTNPTNNGIGQVGTTTVSLYQAANFNPADTANTANLRNFTNTLTAAGTNDNAGKVIDPQFVSASDLHIPVASTLVNMGAGVGVANDIDGQLRVGIPDIGADEPSGTTPLANDISATAFINPANGGAAATGTAFAPQASFTNNGTAAQTNVPVRFRILNASNVEVCNVTATIPTINPSQTVTVTFPTCTLTGAGTYTITAAAELVGDQTPANDTITGTITAVAPLSGTVSVGTGQTYTSLTNAGGVFATLNAAGASSNITINLTSDLTGETGANALNELAGGFTVTIKPSGAARSITGAATAALIALNGADNVTIDGSLNGGTDRSLTINFTAGSAGINVGSGTNGAQNNTIKNVNVVGHSPTAAIVGIGLGSNTVGSAGADNDGNRVQNNSIQGTIFGITSLGASITNKNTGTVITQNTMIGTGTSRVGRVGIYFIFDDGGQITQNTISGIASAEGADAIGIAVGIQNVLSSAAVGFEVSNAVISRNSIGSVVHTATYSAVGIALAASTTGTNVIANNMISGVLANSNAGDVTAGIFVGTAAGGTQNIYFNSVSMTGDRDSVTNSQQGSFALAINGGDNAVNVVDNILVNSQIQGGTGTTGNSYAVGIGYATFVNLNSNYNDFLTSGANGTKLAITGALLNATAGAMEYADLASYQTATGKDANSKSVNPLFVSLTDLHLQATSTLVNMGIAAGGITVDFDGQTRDAMPDIGADEIISAAPQNGTLALSAATYTVAENVAGGTVTVTVNRTSGSDGAVGATYALTNGTATGGATCAAGVDFVNTGGTVSFAAGATTQTFTVAICNDTIFEGNETFNVTLSAPTGGATLGTPATAVVTINDDEMAQPGMLQLSAATYSVGEAGPTATITVTRTGGTDGAVGATYALTNGTATGGTTCAAGVDFVNTGGTVSFTGGQASQTFTVAICNDTVLEGSETFNVTLSAPTGGAILGTPVTAVVTIIDDEVAQNGTLQFNPATYSVGEAGGTVVLTVTRTGGTDGAVSASYSLANGTAMGGATCAANVDFINTGGTISFINGQASQTFTVAICNDTVLESSEAFTASIAAPTGGATIGSPSTATVTIIDDEVAQNGTLALSAATYTVAENVAGGTVTVTVNRTGGSDGAVGATYALTNGTATGGATCAAGVDFVNTGGTVSFAAGATTQTFTVAICNDTIFEGNETFNVTLSGATGGAVIGTPAAAVVTIIDDEVAQNGSLQLSAATYTVAENVAGGTATITVTRTGGSDGAVGATYALTNGTATGGATCAANVDFINTGGTVSFAAGATTQTFTVAI